MELREIIGVGKHRECLATKNPDFCAKRVKSLKIKIRSITDHLLRDINQRELDIYNKLPKELKPFFSEECYKHGKLLITKRPRDYDDSYSKTILELGSVSNPDFWESIDTISELMMKYKLWLFDVFHRGNNIIVQRLSEDIFKPVVIDCKRIGWLDDPLQINLLLDSEKEKKFNRRLERFRRKFKMDI